MGLTVFWTGTGIPKKSVVGRNDGKGPSDHDAEPLTLVFNAILFCTQNATIIFPVFFHSSQSSMITFTLYAAQLHIIHQ